MSKQALVLALAELQSLNTDVTFDYAPHLDDWRAMFADYPDTLDCVNAIKTLEDLRFLCRYNLFFLLIAICDKKHLRKQWTDARCRDCCREPNGQLQLWSREHYKSSIWTVGKSIQDIVVSHGKDNTIDDVSDGIVDAIAHWMGVDGDKQSKFDRLRKYNFNEVTIGIFSATRALAKAFLKEIMTELESNEMMQCIFPDVLYQNPSKFSNSWGVDTGIIVKRKSVRKESTVEAHGLIDGQPTSKHFDLLNFDDIVTHEIARSMVLNQKLVEGWENAFSLGSMGGAYRAEGTRKHYNDPYSVMIERSIFKEIRLTPYDSDGKSVLMSEEDLAKRRKFSGEVTFAAEYLQEPLKNSALGLNFELLQYHTITNTSNLYLYLICDPATEQKKNSDYTAMLLIGIDSGGSVIVIDGIRERLKLSQRWQAINYFYDNYPKLKRIYYEKSGMNTDLEYFREKANADANMSITSLFSKMTPKQAKNDRIAKLEPMLEDKKIFFPETKRKRGYDGKEYDLTVWLRDEEISKFPFSAHDDGMDCLAYCVIMLNNNELRKPVNAVSGNKLEEFYKYQNMRVG